MKGREKMDPNDMSKIHYCDLCAMKDRLPLRLGRGGLVGGYCRLCGVASTFVGCASEAKLKEKGVDVPTLKELSDRNPH